MLHVYQLPLPTTDNQRLPLAALHKDIQMLFVENFGGFTATPCLGGYKNSNGDIQIDNNILYQIGIKLTADNLDSIRAIACFFGAQARQESVFLIHPDGQRELILASQFWKPAAAWQMLANLRLTERKNRNNSWNLNV